MPDAPLGGWRILLTRPRGRVGELAGALTGLGAEVCHAPLLDITPADDLRLPGDLASLGDYGWVICTSVPGADAFLRAAQRLGPPGAARPSVCAVGEATAARLAQGGWPATLVPPVHRAEGVVAALRDAGVGAGTRVLFVKGATARDVVSSQLRAQGAMVTEVTGYRATPLPLDPAAAGRLRADTIDIVVLTSGVVATRFAEACRAEAVALDPAGFTVACLGPITREAATAAGLSVEIVAADTSSTALVAAIVAYAAGRRRPPG